MLLSSSPNNAPTCRRYLESQTKKHKMYVIFIENSFQMRNISSSHPGLPFPHSFFRGTCQHCIYCSAMEKAFQMQSKREREWKWKRGDNAHCIMSKFCELINIYCVDRIVPLNANIWTNNRQQTVFDYSRYVFTLTVDLLFIDFICWRKMGEEHCTVCRVARELCYRSGSKQYRIGQPWTMVWFFVVSVHAFLGRHRSPLLFLLTPH